MKEEILSNLNNPAQLEKLYRTDKSDFAGAFNALYPQLKDNDIAGFWNARLNFAREELSRNSTKDLIFVIFACIVAAFLAKLPALFNIDENFFYPRNIGFIVLPLLSIYFALKNKLSAGKVAALMGITVAAMIYINALPLNNSSDTLVLSCIHLILFLWSLLGFSYVGAFNNENDRRIGFLKFNGDLIVITTLIVIAGGILSAVTIGLFSLIGINIEKFYAENVIVSALPAAPILGTYLTQSNPNLVGRVSPVIAKIFSPLVLVMLIIYLSAMIYSGKNPYNDREFLTVFNALLIGVMAIIFFSVAETRNSKKSAIETWILFLLLITTVVVNAIALSAIIFRISEWGITPNRAAVLGGNGLIFVNLLIITWQFYKVVFKKADTTGVRKVIAQYLPVYFIWTIIVTFIFPLLFGFK